MKTKSRFVERLSWFLDESITLPGGYKIGLDGFIGLIPGIGDFIGGLLSSVIIYKAHQIGVPRMILGRMVINMMIDTVLGAIPVAGDVFDFVWKANKRNAALLDKYQQQPQQVYRKSLIENIIFIAVLLSILVLMIALIGWIIGLIATAISS
ncbi:MAG TPA: DUF4112 domain-containing protein [Methylophaga sp.]|jgi:hypothetical protein|uniref:DUF4112 domain-containing protein n=1 Tax=unclassified Methylophaga TaxID=2629249 RepID=UPI000C9223B8|nr:MULTISPECIES: DUF4112 domain-containing protein [unclassified Methylophaga]MAP26073.1 hypothetical protein [Methylophaga sp.]HAD31041.1 DUF4112 domain-containing protein [Methylophaga sp.]|tara:strand:- start:37 stop:492 length:456 start_codon:yes stop_codon:yes gene_type:complete